MNASRKLREMLWVLQIFIVPIVSPLSSASFIFLGFLFDYKGVFVSDKLFWFTYVLWAHWIYFMFSLLRMLLTYLWNGDEPKGIWREQYNLGYLLIGLVHIIPLVSFGWSIGFFLLPIEFLSLAMLFPYEVYMVIIKRYEYV